MHEILEIQTQTRKLHTRNTSDQNTRHRCEILYFKKNKRKKLKTLILICLANYALNRLSHLNQHRFGMCIFTKLC